ncbi:hypothetical protein ACW9HQ_53120, partial [Nocardia gipuzkoensis]
MMPESVRRLLPWYPELETAGDLRGVIQDAMDRAGFEVTVLASQGPDRRWVVARVEDGTRSVGIRLDADE